MRARMPRRMLTSSFSRPRAREQAPQPRQQALRHARVEEIAARPACARRARTAPRSRPASRARMRGARHTSPPSAATRSSYAATCTAAARLSDANAGFGGNRRDELAARELGVRESRHLGAEDERDIAVRGVAPSPRARRRAPAARAPANSRGRAESPIASAAPASASSSVATTRARVEDCGGAGGERVGLGIGKALRRDQHQSRRAHRQHRARGRADVARMAGRARARRGCARAHRGSLAD